MNRTLLPIRIAFVAACTVGGWLICYTIPQWDKYQLVASLIGFLCGVLMVLTDVLLKGFSIRGLSAVTFGVLVGTWLSHMVLTSPLFEGADPTNLYLSRLAVFLSVTYLSTVIALRGKDEFNLVIPYVRFVPTEVETPLIVVDTSALIDGRVARLCETGFLASVVVVPRFVIDELQRVADSSDPSKQARGQKGLETLTNLRKVKGLEIRIPESEVANRKDVDAKLVFLAQSMKARILTLDMNLARLAEFQGVHCLNLHALSRALRIELIAGQVLEVELTKAGKEEGQAVGYLEDGNMVVVENAKPRIGMRLNVEIVSLVPSAGGKIVFARLFE